MNHRETRTTKGLELKDAPKDSGYIGVIEGYAIRYETDSHEMRSRDRKKPVVERIARGAFTKSLAEKRDIVAVVDHDPGKAFARRGVNLELTEDDTGVHYRALIPDTTVGRDLRTNVKLGILNANSFEFEVRKKDGKPTGVEWQTGEQRDVRVVRDAELFHVSPVIEPAYSGTTLQARHRDGLVADSEREERGYYSATGYYNYGDPTLSRDSAYATNAMSRALYEMNDSLEYLRADAAGAHAEAARAAVAAAAERITALIGWLAANGATVNPDLSGRATRALEAARELSAPAAGGSVSNDARPLWEQRVRFLR